MNENLRVTLDYEACHKALWTWLAKYPDKDKIDWPGWGTIIQLDKKGYLKVHAYYHLKSVKCFACQIVFPFTNDISNKLNCSKCPVYFGAEDCEEPTSYYRIWVDEGEHRGLPDWAATRTKYATLIAEGWGKKKHKKGVIL